MLRRFTTRSNGQRASGVRSISRGMYGETRRRREVIRSIKAMVNRRKEVVRSFGVDNLLTSSHCISETSGPFRARKEKAVKTRSGDEPQRVRKQCPNRGSHR